MTKEKAGAIVAQYEQLLADALGVVSRLPRFVHDEGRRLEIKGDVAVIVSCNDTSDGYGWTGVEEERVEFPLAMLLATGAERDALVAEWRAERARECDAANAAHIAKLEAEERRAYEALKAKFG